MTRDEIDAESAAEILGEAIMDQVMSWYCHSCHQGHVQTAVQRDSHRDALMRSEAARIDAHEI